MAGGPTLRGAYASTLLTTALLLPVLALADPGANDGHPGPTNLVLVEKGYALDRVTGGLSFPASLAFRGDKLLVLEMGRYAYAEPIQGRDKGVLRELTLASNGTVTASRAVLTHLEDPIGLAVAPDGDVLVTQYGRVTRVPAALLDAGVGAPYDVSWGYPSQMSDGLYLPVTGTNLPAAAAGAIQSPDPLAGETTGPMGLAFDGSGQLHVTTAAHGVPPDDDGLRPLTGLDYDNPYSSSLVVPTGGALTPDQVAARGCRNCFDLAFAPPGTAHAGRLFVTENVGAYRLRAFSGSDRSVLAGGAPTENNVLDSVDVVDFGTGHFRRVATFRPDGALLGATPTGIAFAPKDFGSHANAMFVALWSGFTPSTDDRGELAVVRPDLEHGLGIAQPFLLGLDFPNDVVFGPDGALYVVEFFNGIIYRVRTL